MSADYDPTEFIDGDFQSQKVAYSVGSATASQLQRAPTREEVDSKGAEAPEKLTELRRAQEELERQRAGLEETRRRQLEFHNGRQEMIQSLTRALGLLQEAEFNSRRDAEQMAKGMVDLREALTKVEAIHQEGWTQDNFDVELTRALTTLENARMEWNSARLKFSLLSGQAKETTPNAATPTPGVGQLTSQSFGELCRVGLALTWPVAVAVLLTSTVLLALLLRR